MRSQISTITVATFNTTLASFNVGYADFFSEHMRKLCNQVPIPEMPHEPLACANLPRSLTDSCINYSCLEDTDHIDGTNNFVHKNGMLDLSVIGKGMRKARSLFCQYSCTIEIRVLMGFSSTSLYDFSQQYIKVSQIHLCIS